MRKPATTSTTPENVTTDDETPADTKTPDAAPQSRSPRATTPRAPRTTAPRAPRAPAAKPAHPAPAASDSAARLGAAKANAAKASAAKAAASRAAALASEGSQAVAEPAATKTAATRPAAKRAPRKAAPSKPGSAAIPVEPAPDEGASTGLLPLVVVTPATVPEEAAVVEAAPETATPDIRVAEVVAVEEAAVEEAAVEEAVVEAAVAVTALEETDVDAVAPAGADIALEVPETIEAAPTVGAQPEAAPPVKAPARPAKAVGKRTPRATRVPKPVEPAVPSQVVLSVTGLRKTFGHTIAVSGIDLEVRAGSFYGIVGPNGAGKTTTLSMITGLLRPDAGTILVNGIDVWASPISAKRVIGVLPDRLRLFDRLTGAQLLYYSGVLRGLDGATVRKRSADLAAAFGLEDALNRLVADYSAGMTKKIALACAMIHSPRVLVLDEPFESVDPVSAVNVTEILQKYVASGGTVVLSSHGMDLIQRVCDHVAIIVQGAVLAAGTIDEVRGSNTLEERFIELAGGRKEAEGMEWLHSFSD